MSTPRKKKNGNGNGSTSTRVMKRKKPINAELMVDIKPLTANQSVLFDAYSQGVHHCFHAIGDCHATETRRGCC